MIKLRTKIRDFCCVAVTAVLGLFLAFQVFAGHGIAFADDENFVNEAHFVTIYDENSTLTIKTTAATVREALEKSEIEINSTDLVEPGLDSVIDGNNYNINIHRARPAVVIDGQVQRYVMTASYDPKTIAREAGLTIYDGDEITVETNQNFLEVGAASTFRVKRNGGRSLTVEEVLPYTTETRYDYNMTKGERQLEQAGEDGRRISVYEVKFENNVEVSRELVSEEIIVEAVPEIVTVGAQITVAPGDETCVGWLREVGVAEEDLEAALYIINHESHCRVDAENSYSGAYGIPQALPGSKMASAGEDWRTNPLTQLRWMDSYVRNRYGSWQAALQFKQAKGWY